MCEQKLRTLEERLREYAKCDVCIAFSGGIDSSLILKLISRYAKENGTQVYAVTFDTKLHPRADVLIAKQVAEECGATHIILTVDETKNPAILNNPVDRCYYCKKYLFETLINWAKKQNIEVVMEGTNADDLGMYRPGIRAVRELMVKSPLMEANLSKDEIRIIARKFNLSVANRPSQPCMATRLPYNTNINFEVLQTLDEGEVYLRNLGFVIVRLRLHGEILRIEIESDQFSLFLEKRLVIIEKMKQLGFDYITLDAEGFRSGSMDIHIMKEERTRIEHSSVEMGQVK
ncbi:MAG: ATP-dependent sacrificial sulfur transferase LarE [Velocimicrobium sp.]